MSVQSMLNLFWKNMKVFSQEERCVFRSDYVQAFDIRSQQFDKLMGSVQELVKSSIPEDIKEENGISQDCSYETLFEYLNQTERFAIAKDVEKLIVIEQQFLELLKLCARLSSFAGLEVPVNIRVAQSSAPKGYTDGAYATDKLHCDIWAGEPSDIIQVLLYLDADESSTRVEFRDVDDGAFCKFESLRGEYSQVAEGAENLPVLDIPVFGGCLIVFDGRVPHRTIRGDRARLSLDARLRLIDPYTPFKDEETSANIPGDKYWFFPEEQLESNWASRVIGEVKKLNACGKYKEAQMRKSLLGKVKF